METERPKLRNIEPIPMDMDGKRAIVLRDPFQFCQKTLAVPEEVFFILSLMDGEHTILDIQDAYMRKYGELLFSDRVREIVAEMDENFLLESERFEAHRREVEARFRKARVRKAAHAGSAYEADPIKLAAQLDSFFTPPEGPGTPAPDPALPPVKGIVAPHIDFHRGGHCYAWAYHALAQSCEAEVFLIFGTVHVPTRRLFTLTRKNFETPLGRMAVDRDLASILLKRYGDRLLDDELAHKVEHTIEFQVVFLQHVFGGRRRVHIVPVLCSSFLEAAKDAPSPMAVAEVREFVEVVKEEISSRLGRVCVVASADLAHVGPRFGDRYPLTPGRLSLVETEDREMLRCAEKLDADGLFRAVAKGGDPRHICGLPPLYVLLSTITASSGQLLKYAQAADPNGQSCVSFAAMVFH